MLLDQITRLFQRRPATPAWAREVVAAIPAAELPSSIRTFAEQATRTRDPRKRAMQMAKLYAATERLEVQQ